MLPMVDLSNHAGDVTASDLAGTALVAAKCTEYGPGFTYADPDYAKFRSLAKAVGARFLAYHFAHPATSAAESWSFFAEHAQLRPGDLYACDLEVSDGLPAAAVAQWGSAFAHAGFGQFRAWPWAYSDREFIANGNLDGMAMCPLWIAIPGPRPPENSPAPAIPPFSKTIAEQWQFGTPPLNIDRDVVYLDSTSHLELYGIPTPDHAAEAKAATEVASVERQLRGIGRLLRRLSHG